MEVMNMNIENNYPKVQRKVNKFLLFRKVVVVFFIVAFIVSLIVNLSVGGRLWCMYIFFGELLFYFAFVNKPLIDNVLIKRISILLLIIIGYLYTIDKINDTSWSYIVIDILCFSILILQLIFFFINYDYYKNKIIIMVFTSLFSCILCLLGIIKVIPINWALIVTGSIGLLNLLILMTFYFKNTVLELKKYFSLK